MSFLLDTNVISEVRKPHANDAVARWFDSVSADELYLSVLVVGEIRRGIERLRVRDSDQAAVFDGWLSGLKSDFEDRVLPVSAVVAEAWGRLDAPAPLPLIDGLLAATALAHGLTLVTRDTAVPERLGLPVLDPWQA